MDLKTPRRFLFAIMDGGGNVAPTLGVVSDLVRRGHRVRVMAEDLNQAEVRDVGARFVPWTRAPNKTARSRDTDPLDWMLPTARDGLRVVSEAFMGGMAQAYAQDVVEELDREGADLVVTMDMLLGVAAACEARGQALGFLNTYISTFPVPGVPPFGEGLAPATTAGEQALHADVAAEVEAALDGGLPGLNAARSALGLRPLAHLADQASTAAALWLGTARAFDFAPDPAPGWLHYVGPLIRDPDWAAPWISPWPPADRRPLVVAAFSTGFQNHAGVLQRVIDAASALPVRLLVTLGGSIRRDELAPADNTRIVDSAPHTRVMPEAAAVVTHGGHGTVMTALVNRLPLLVIPHGRDQGDNAVRIAERGAGLQLTSSASTDQIRAALDQLLGDPDFAASARRLGDAVAAEAAQSTLIRQMEDLAGSVGASAGAQRVHADDAYVIGAPPQAVMRRIWS